MRLTDLWRDEDGQDLIEYSLLMAFIALSVVSLLTAVNHDVFNLWTSINSKVTSAASAQAGS